MPVSERITVPLFIDGEQFFPRLFQAIKNARDEVIVETFELGEDRVGRGLLRAMRLAIWRGAKVYLTYDAWGSMEVSDPFRQQFIDAGVRVQVFEPLSSSPLGKLRMYGRLHRKLAVIDRRIAFIGGINLRYCHMLEYGEDGKRDVAAEIVGPKVDELRQLCLSHLPANVSKSRVAKAEAANSEAHEVTKTSATMRFLFRNNREKNDAIEKAWIELIDSAKFDLTIAVAYFFPGEEICKALINARKRNVEVNLVVQANPDQMMVLTAAQSLYNEFLDCGINIVEYKERPLHAKVMQVDKEFAIIGSSNLDPWSLHLNLEASVIVEDKPFANQLNGFLTELIEVSEPIRSRNDLITFFAVRPSRTLVKRALRGVKDSLKSLSVRDPLIVSYQKDDKPKKFRMKGESAKNWRPHSIKAKRKASVRAH